MLRFPQFVQECPVCGRPLEIRLEYLGRRVGCQHCGGRFVASDPSDPSARPGTSELGRNRLLHRVDSLLEQSTHRLRLADGPARGRSIGGAADR